MERCKEWKTGRGNEAEKKYWQQQKTTTAQSKLSNNKNADETNDAHTENQLRERELIDYEYHRDWMAHWTHREWALGFVCARLYIVRLCAHSSNDRR